MLYWNKYNGHESDICGKRKKFDNTIYAFDIETTSYLLLDGKQVPAIDYLKLSKKDFVERINQEVVKLDSTYVCVVTVDTDYTGRQ